MHADFIVNALRSGGAWEFGSNSFGGAYNGETLALKHGVVVVAANYRLDALGWIALEELAAEDPDSAYGNYGTGLLQRHYNVTISLGWLCFS